MSDFIAAVRRLRVLGYSRTASLRLALWACNPDAPLYPERETP